MYDENKKNIFFISLIGVLFILLSYFIIILQMYYGLIDITSNLILNTLLIISGAIFNILVVKFLKLEEKLLKNKKLLIIYLVFIVVAINIFDWIIQPMINYFNIINYLPLSFFAGFGGGILVSFFYLIIWENNKYLTHSKF